MKSIRLLLPFTLLASSLLFTPACTKAQGNAVLTAINDITPVGACIADIVLATTGIEDPQLIASNCSAAVSDVYTVVSELLDANNAPTAADGGTPLAMTISTQGHLQRIKARAFSLMGDAGATPIVVKKPDGGTK